LLIVSTNSTVRNFHSKIFPFVFGKVRIKGTSEGLHLAKFILFGLQGQIPLLTNDGTTFSFVVLLKTLVKMSGNVILVISKDGLLFLK